MEQPAIDPLFDHAVNPHEGRALLQVGIRKVTLAHPMIEQKYLAARSGGQLDHGLEVAVLHAKNQISLAQHGRSELTGAMCRAVDAMLSQHLQCCCRHWLSTQRLQASTGDLDIARRQALPQHVLGSRTATDVAYAYGQYPFDHCTESLLKAKLNASRVRN